MRGHEELRVFFGAAIDGLITSAEVYREGSAELS